MLNETINKRENKFIGSLTGIRAIAAYFVFLYHYNPGNIGGIAWKIVNELHTGVDIFFVLSGFLITYRYYDNFKITKNWLKTYVINRIARIYPMFFLFTIIVYIFKIYFGYVHSSFNFYEIIKHNLFELFLNLTFLKGFFNDFKFIGIAAGWTLTVEECFYFIAPFIFLLVKKINLFIISFSFLLIGILIVHFAQNKINYGFFDSYRFMLTFTFFGKSFDFFIGIWLALLIRKEKKRKNHNFPYLTSFSIMIFFIFIIIISNVREIFPNSLYQNFIINFFLPFSIAGLLYGLIIEKSILKNVLESNLFLLLGKSSYIFYLIHQGILYLFLEDFISKSLLINFIIINFLSILFFKYIEEPMNYKIKSLNVP